MTTIRVVNVKGVNRPDDRRVIAYVGRPFAGWPGHPLANPFRLTKQIKGTPDVVAKCLDRYRHWLDTRPTLEADLARLWEECKQGTVPLGCWCIDTEVRPHEGSGPLVCHAQIIAHELLKRFGAELRCCICRRPATSHYAPGAPSCGRAECELRMQAVVDAHEERGG